MVKLGAVIIALLFTMMACNKPAPAPLPKANFFVENNNCISICSLYFYDQSENAVKWRWNFGNGEKSTNPDDTAIYTIPDTYEVWLHVWNEDDVKDSVRKTVFIN